MPDIYEWTGVALAVGVLAGIRLMNRPETAAIGNRLSALCLLAAIVMVLWRNGALTAPVVLAALVAGTLVGLILALRVTMLQMPQLVALLNGLGGAASLLTAFVAAVDGGMAPGLAGRIPAALAVAVGGVTLSGSLVAAGKLHRLLPQRPLRLRGHRIIASVLLATLILLTVPGAAAAEAQTAFMLASIGVCALAFGAVFALPVGGADMPITISLLNSTSGLAASICGFVVNDAFLVAAGAIVGAAGLLLTRAMCAAMNRPLRNVLTGAIAVEAGTPAETLPGAAELPSPDGEAPPGGQPQAKAFEPVEALLQAQSVVVIPGYGMALGEAETQVRDLYELLVTLDKDVTFAIHPVAGRMPGHMTVLLADVDIPYDRMVQLDAINPRFAQTDVALVVGACDVVNPAAITAQGTPIYGMPILLAHEAQGVIVCNLDTKPGYSGVENPLYQRPNVVLLLGNAAETLDALINDIRGRIG